MPVKLVALSVLFGAIGLAGHVGSLAYAARNIPGLTECYPLDHEARHICIRLKIPEIEPLKKIKDEPPRSPPLLKQALTWVMNLRF